MNLQDIRKNGFHTKLTNTANLGLRVAAPDIVTGWDRPGDIFGRMDLINVQAQRLAALIRENVAAGAWRAGWDAWLAEWTRLYNVYAGPNESRWAQLGIILPASNKALDQRVSQEESQLHDFNEQYNALKRANGTVVPPLEPLQDTSRLTSGSSGSSLPWWFWVMGGVALVGAGYLIYRKVNEGRAKLAYAKKEGPSILEKFLPGYGDKAYAYSQAGRDPLALPLRAPEQPRYRDQRIDDLYEHDAPHPPIRTPADATHRFHETESILSERTRY